MTAPPTPGPARARKERDWRCEHCGERVAVIISVRRQPPALEGIQARCVRVQGGRQWFLCDHCGGLIVWHEPKVA